MTSSRTFVLGAGKTNTHTCDNMYMFAILIYTQERGRSRGLVNTFSSTSTTENTKNI